MAEPSRVESSILRLERQVEAAPRQAGPRLRLGLLLLEAGRLEQGASQLQLAARLEPATPQAALIAAAALVRVERARDAALLLSVHVREQRRAVRLAQEEVSLIRALLSHPEPFVRCHTARALGRLFLVDTVEALERLVIDEVDAAVRLAAEGSLRRLVAH